MIKEKKINNIIEPYFNLPKEVYVIFFSRIINAMGAFVWTVMALILQDKLGYTEQGAGRIITTAAIILIIPPLIGGKLADIFSKKAIIVIFDIIGLTCYFICGFLEPNILLLVFIFLASVFYSIAGPAHDALLADLSTPENRKQVYALSYMGWNLGYAFGGGIAGYLYVTNLALVFIGDAFTTLISLLLIIFFIKNVKINKESEKNLENEENDSIFAVLLRRPKLLAFGLIIMGFNFVYSQWGFLIQTNLLNIYGDSSAKYYGLMCSLNAVIVICFTAIISSIFIKTRHFKLIVIGGLFYAIGFGLLGFFQNLVYFYICIVVFTFGEILLTISVSPYIFNHTPSNHRGRMSAALGFIMGMGWIFGPLITGNISFYYGFEFTWRIIGVIAIVCSLLMYLLGKIDKPIEEIKVIV